MTFRLRDAGLGDIDWIINLEGQEELKGLICPWTGKQHSHAMQDGDTRYVVAVKEGVMVGFAILAGLQSNNRSIELKRIVMGNPGDGDGRRLIEQLLDWVFGDMRAKRFWLDVFPENKRAREVYRKLGFKEEGTLRDVLELNGERRSLVIMSMLPDEYAALKGKGA